MATEYFAPKTYGVAIDVSGSQVTFDFKKAKERLKRLTAYKGKQIFNVVYFDHSVVKEASFSTVDEITIPRDFNGGTDFNVAWNRISGKSPDGLFVMSDGMFHENPRFKYTLITDE